MTVQLVIFILALAAIIFFFKNFNACVYFVVMIDIFLRIVTFLTEHYLRADAFSFLDAIPSSVLAMLNSFKMGVLNEVLVIIYVIIYIIKKIPKINNYVC